MSTADQLQTIKASFPDVFCLTAHGSVKVYVICFRQQKSTSFFL